VFLILLLSFLLPKTPLLADAFAASGECSLDLERQSLERQTLERQTLERQSLERQSQLARTYRLFGDRPEPRHRPSS
jgi:hypothetical protein